MGNAITHNLRLHACFYKECHCLRLYSDHNRELCARLCYGAGEKLGEYHHLVCELWLVELPAWQPTLLMGGFLHPQQVCKYICSRCCCGLLAAQFCLRQQHNRNSEPFGRPLNVRAHVGFFGLCEHIFFTLTQNMSCRPAITPSY